MKRLAVALAALGFAGCDMTVSELATHVETHGVVAAHMDCYDPAATSNGTEYKVSIFLDGSTIARVRSQDGAWEQFCGPSEDCASTGRVTSKIPGASQCTGYHFESGQYFKEGGDCSLVASPDLTRDIDTYCTGFNLEAFD